MNETKGRCERMLRVRFIARCHLALGFHRARARTRVGKKQSWDSPLYVRWRDVDDLELFLFVAPSFPADIPTIFPDEKTISPNECRWRRIYTR